MKPVTMMSLLALMLSGCVLIARDEPGSTGGLEFLDGQPAISLDGVERIRFAAGGRLHIQQGSEDIVRVLGSSDVTGNLVVSRSGDTLTFEPRYTRWVSAGDARTVPLEVHVTVASLDEITVIGQGSVQLASMNTDHLHIEVHGGGEVLVGRLVADEVRYIVTGRGRLIVDEVIGGKLRGLVTGHGRSVIRSVRAARVESHIQGNGVVTLAGTTDLQRATIVGHGHLSASALKSGSAGLKVEGHGGANVQARRITDLQVGRHGVVEYVGFPSHGTI